ncbi:rhomboid family intramembrane serine protease [Bartonella sp. CB175]|uniref:rhomboid family intramembrane serine protease n=1 Tax=Bartonella sp. CB175 TaxID=3112256 RepID=UPI00300E2191
MKDTDFPDDNNLLLPKKYKESLLNVPFIIVALIALCFLIYFVSQYFFSDQLFIESFKFFSFTPMLFKGDPLAFCHTIVSYSFMHGSFEHIAINMAWLLVFGSPLVRHFGSLRFLFFWILTAIISALTYFIFHQNSIVSLVGASGAISGMMGAVARYDSFFTHLGAASPENEKKIGALLSIKKALCSRNVLSYISVWLIINFIVGVFSSVFERDNVSIAWEAHVGGLVSGFLLVGFFNISQDKSKVTA